MGYLFLEIMVYLLVAVVIGFVLGWAYRDGVFERYMAKFKSDSNGQVESSNANSDCSLAKLKEMWKEFYASLTTTKKVSDTEQTVKEETQSVGSTVNTEEQKELKETPIPQAVKPKIEENILETKVEKVKDEVKQEIENKVTEEPEKEVTVEAVKEETEKVVEDVQEVVSKEVEVEQEKVVETLEEEKVEKPNEEEITVDEKDAPELFAEAPESGQDKLSTIKGIGPVIEKKLNDLGIYQFAQIASWTKEQELWIGSQIAFPTRVMREEWVKQAKELVKHKAEKI